MFGFRYSEGPYFVKEHSDSKSKYTEDHIINMLEFLVDKSFVVRVGNVFQQIVGIPIGINCAPLLADISALIPSEIHVHTVFSLGRKDS